MSESKNIQSDLIPKIATGFCSGIARTSGVCGAVSGAIMAISLFFGRSTPDESMEKNYVLVQKLIDTFENEFGSTNCKELIECDLRTEKGQETFKTRNLVTKCRRMTEDVTRMVMVILEDEA